MKQIETKIRQGIEELTPDVLPAVLSSPAPKLEQADWELTHPSSGTRLLTGTKTAALLAACLFLFLGLRFYWNNLAPDATIDLDVNPSIELVTNKKKQIIQVHAGNQDGQMILGDMNLKNTDLSVGINAIIGSMVRQGFLTEVQNSILVTVQSKDSSHARELQLSIAGSIKEVLDSKQISGSVYYQQAEKEESAAAAQISRQYDISIGKAIFLLRLANKAPELLIESLADKTLQEIADIISSRDIDISDIAGYEPDESTPENVEEIIEEQNEQQADRKQPKAAKSSQKPKQADRYGDRMEDDDDHDRGDDDRMDDDDDDRMDDVSDRDWDDDVEEADDDWDDDDDELDDDPNDDSPEDDD